MENYINVVASTVCLVAQWSRIRGNYRIHSIYTSVTPTGDNKLYYGNIIIDMDKGLGFDYYKKLFSQLSLSQLRDILYLIVPCASNFTYMKNGEFVETTISCKHIGTCKNNNQIY